MAFTDGGGCTRCVSYHMFISKMCLLKCGLKDFGQFASTMRPRARARARVCVCV